MADRDAIEIIRTGVTVDHLARRAEETFGDLVKAVVDVDGGVMAIGGGMHADEEAVLLDLGSRQGAVWGINLYPTQFRGGDWIEFDSMINVRPGQGNRSRSVEDPTIRKRIVEIVTRLADGG